MRSGFLSMTLISIAMLATGVCVAQDDSLFDYWEHSSPAFSQDGKEVYWSAQIVPRKQRIFHVMLEEWERFYNCGRPYGAFDGKTPYEALQSML